MATSPSTPHTPAFLRLTPALRQRIYSYLLPPHPDEETTTIVYDLKFPYLQHPSSTTFTPHQLDICTCPLQPLHQQDAENPSPPGCNDHIYSRYICCGPEVIVRPGTHTAWVLQQAGPAFNVLRPATDEELQRRPHAGIVLVNKAIYSETLPVLYRNRNFLLLTGICSRGRYQAYATQTWLSGLSPLARSNVTSLTLLCHSNEEDCRDEDAQLSYTDFARFCLDEVTSLQRLRLKVWPDENGISLRPFSILLGRPDFAIHMVEHLDVDDVFVFRDAATFLHYCNQKEQG
ncbi:uncharacterized protein EI97DRAFT_431764 [Westerdykella ornata]|uniref:Uncharacterized protein n=1 Tax=Westerdykella ornata TaxID=318751 RepID=A0A6A6JRP3_WESOR|nr:uncharacterized protein EI97DRAFT_431764 [Westerdykella ornata]KAF2278538.1 hypothetical protein EI97DRAFT_431764 [Westerdykella ornata]